MGANLGFHTGQHARQPLPPPARLCAQCRHRGDGSQLEEQGAGLRLGTSPRHGIHPPSMGVHFPRHRGAPPSTGDTSKHESTPLCMGVPLQGTGVYSPGTGIQPSGTGVHSLGMEGTPPRHGVLLVWGQLSSYLPVFTSEEERKAREG